MIDVLGHSVRLFACGGGDGASTSFPNHLPFFTPATTNSFHNHRDEREARLSALVLCVEMVAFWGLVVSGGSCAVGGCSGEDANLKPAGDCEVKGVKAARTPTGLKNVCGTTLRGILRAGNVSTVFAP